MKIGVAGLGLMGSAMANRLLKTGFELAVYNRSRAKAEKFAGRAKTLCRLSLQELPDR